MENRETPPANRPAFPELPIIRLEPEAPKRSEVEKYGGLYRLGLIGLLVIVALVGWFAVEVYRHKEIWTDVYVLHDESKPEADRIEAAFRLSRDSRVNQRQLWDICMRKQLPPLARYLIAEGLDSEAAAADPKGYAVAVAKSEGWPNWLRLLLERPMAYGVERGLAFPADSLDLLRGHEDPFVSAWASYIRALSEGGTEAAVRQLEDAAKGENSAKDPRAKLLEALNSQGAARRKALDEAVILQRSAHPEAAKLWESWEERDGRLVRK